MKNIVLRILIMIALVAGFHSCTDDDYEIGEITAPTDLQVNMDVVGQSDEAPEGDGSGTVNFSASANGAMTYKYVFSDGASGISSDGDFSYQFSESGDYTVSIIAYGPGGTSSSTTMNVSVFVDYTPPQDLIDKLVGDGSKEWRIKAEAPAHFGLGPVGGTNGPEFYATSPNEKVGVGMYDDRYIFNADRTFTHIVDTNNDDPDTDPSGTVFGRVNLVNQLGGVGGGTVDGADVLNYVYEDYTENWAIAAPGGVETIVLTGTGFIGYYTGGDHRYEIFDRSTPNELLLRTTDGNGEFDWWFLLTSEGEEEEEDFESQFDNLIFEAAFDDETSLDTSIWNYETGNGTDGWGNNEVQYYTEDNVSVENGNLVITARREAESGFDFTSGRITTQDNFEFTYGRVEVRAKMPEGGGTWPAIWMLGANFNEVGWPATGEIDIMEFVGNNPDEVSAALHFPENFGGNAIVERTDVANASSEFHVYGLEWTEDELIFLLDGEVFFRYDNNMSLPFNKDFFLILNVAMGGSLGGDIDPDFQESAMEVDYVRVYQ